MIIKEHTLQEQIIQLLKLHNYIVFSMDLMIGNRFIKDTNSRFLFINKQKKLGYTKGQPDIVIISPTGKITFIELKNKKGKQSEEQKIVQEELQKRNVDYLLWNSFDDALKFVEK